MKTSDFRSFRSNSARPRVEEGDDMLRAQTLAGGIVLMQAIACAAFSSCSPKNWLSPALTRLSHGCYPRSTVLTLRCASSTPDREPLAPPAGVARHSLLPAELLPAELVDSDQILVDRVQARKQRRMIQTSMYTGGVGMAVAASLATLDLQIVCATMLTLAAALTSYKHTVWDGHNRDSGLCVPMHQTSFEIFKVAGKGNGLFSSCHISKGQFLMRYEGERIDDLEFERRYASDPFSDEAGYVMRVTDDEFIDGSNPEISGFARYMNHAQTPNVDKYIAQRPGGTCSFFAARDISAGEELVISYGDEYWVAKGLSPVA